MNLNLIVIQTMLSLGMLSIANAEIIVDGSLGERQTLTGADYIIEARFGRTEETNLFHSFEVFNLQNHETATFIGDSAIQNIINRVTGGNASTVNGSINSEIEGANVYLLNPHGIQLGDNARLNISGSFYASTADYLQLGEGEQAGFFYADALTKSTFTSAEPTAFGFLDDQPTSISINRSQLKVGAQHTLALVGGDIAVTNSHLSAPAGELVLVAVGSAGEFRLVNQDARRFEKMGDMTLERSTFETRNPTSEAKAGVHLQAHHLLLNDSIIDTTNDNNRPGDGGDIEITTHDSVTIQSSDLIANNQADDHATGSIKIKTRKLLIEKDSLIQAINNGKRGQVGVISLQADEIRLADHAQIQSESVSMANKIEIIADNIELRDRCTIANTSVNGMADIIVEGTNLTLSNHSSLMATSIESGGNIVIKLKDSLVLRNNSEIITESNAAGGGGNIEIEARFVLVDNSSSIINTNGINGEFIDSSNAINNPSIGAVSKKSSHHEQTRAAGDEDLGSVVILSLSRAVPQLDTLQGLCSVQTDTKSQFNDKAGQGGFAPAPNAVMPVLF